MEDSQIVALYWQREENAIRQTQLKYGSYCRSIAYHILQSPEDAEECEIDTYTGAWNAMPPHRPEILRTFLGKISRRIAIKRLRERNADRRGNGDIPLAFEELESCIPSYESPYDAMETAELTALLNRFLENLPQTQRQVFLRRYFYCDAVKEIAERFGSSESKVKMMLKRTRDALLVLLQQEDVKV